MPSVVAADTFSGFTKGQIRTILAQEIGHDASSTKFRTVADNCIKRAIATVHAYKRWKFLRRVDVEFTLTAGEKDYELSGDSGIPGILDVMHINSLLPPYGLTQMNLAEYEDKLRMGASPNGPVGAWVPLTATLIRFYPTPNTNEQVLVNCNLGMPALTDDDQRGPWPSRYDHVFLCWAEYYIRKWRRLPTDEARRDAEMALVNMHYADNTQPSYRYRIRHEYENQRIYQNNYPPGRDFR